MSNIITPNPVPELNSQSGTDPRTACYIKRTRNILLMPAPGGSVTGGPNWGGGFLMSPAYYGIDYDQEWTMENVTLPITYNVQSGALPPGLTLGAFGLAGGKITGRATQLGTFSFTLRATNVTGTADQSFSITVNNDPISGFV